jgi:hypothetical protein
MDMNEHYKSEHLNEVTLFGATNFRNQLRNFGIKTDDRRRHMYVIGKSGTGKTTLLENLMYQDIQNGHGLALVDPHGDFAEKIIGFVPKHRENDVIYVNPADIDFPVGFNVLEWKKEEQKFLIGAGLMGVFKKIWPDVWSARMEHIMNNCILALLDYPNSTLLGINRILTDRDYRRIVINAVKDPVVKSFWLHEFERWEPKFQKEAVAPIQNKVGQFLSSTLIRNIVAQTKSTFDVRDAMDSGKIIVINLSKGRIGEDSSRLLGGMLITKIQLAAMERVDMPEADRKDFYLYVDEFQNFATESFANILSEARKYRLNLIVAHQYTKQLDEMVAAAVFGNVGSILCFRVGAEDAAFLEPEFMPDFTQEDLVNIPNYQIYLKLMIDGVTSKPFSANTLNPIGRPNMQALEEIIGISRKLYAKPRAEVEKSIIAWSESYVDESRPLAAAVVPAVVKAPVAHPAATHIPPRPPMSHAAPAVPASKHVAPAAHHAPTVAAVKPSVASHAPVHTPAPRTAVPVHHAAAHHAAAPAAKPVAPKPVVAKPIASKPVAVKPHVVEVTLEPEEKEEAPKKPTAKVAPVAPAKPPFKVVPKGANGEFGGKIRIVKEVKEEAPKPKAPHIPAKPSQKSKDVFPW